MKVRDITLVQWIEMGRQFIILLAALRILGWETPFWWALGLCLGVFVIVVVTKAIIDECRDVIGSRHRSDVS